MAPEDPLYLTEKAKLMFAKCKLYYLRKISLGIADTKVRYETSNFYLKGFVEIFDNRCYLLWCHEKFDSYICKHQYNNSVLMDTSVCYSIYIGIIA